MAGKFHHESIYRGPELLAKLASLRVALCGVGAVGSNLADNLARQGVTHIRAIDEDRVEEHNVSTQAYGEADVGAWKVEALRNRLFRVAGVEIEAVRKELTEQNARQLLGGCDLVIDAFDNSASRALVQQAVRAAGTPCLHVGLHADYAEVVWDEMYRVPQDVAGDVCDYPLARNLVLLAVAVASEAVVRFAVGGERAAWSASLGDLAVQPAQVAHLTPRPPPAG
jgi:molybdopterin/thiamine biosynthesis adenylyltransferase